MITEEENVGLLH